MDGFKAITKSDPLKFAIRDITAKTSVENQRRLSIDKLFDFDESDVWQTKRGIKSVPFDIVMDLTSINQLDKLTYLPPHAGKGNTNGALLKGKVLYGNTKENWTAAGTFEK